MSKTMTVTLVALLWLLMSVGCVLLPDTVVVHVPAGRPRFCTEVRPLPWERDLVQSHREARYGEIGFFEFRVSNSGDFLVGLQPSRYGRSLIFTERFRMDRSVPGAAALASEEEWNKGVQIKISPPFGNETGRFVKGEDPLKNNNITLRKDNRPFEYKDQTFKKSGDLWESVTPALFSPGEKYVALQSWNGADYGPEGTSGYGNFYFDVYRVSSGRQIVSIKGHRFAATVSVGFQAHWISSVDFVVTPYDLQPKFLWCRFPE